MLSSPVTDILGAFCEANLNITANNIFHDEENRLY
jgi:hypothetical protein